MPLLLQHVAALSKINGQFTMATETSSNWRADANIPSVFFDT